MAVDRQAGFERARQADPTRVETAGQSDSDLLLLVLRGDADALGVIYDRHVGAAWKLALALSGSVAVAERAVSAAFMRLWREPAPDDRTPLSARILADVWREASQGRRH